MSTSADNHTEKGEQIAESLSSMHDSDSESQLNDDDCVSENSFGSSFGDNSAMDEEDVTADIELPAYSDEEYPQSTSSLDDMYVKSPPASVDLTVVPQYTPPTRSTQPAVNVKFSVPSMCVVRGFIFNPALILI